MQSHLANLLLALQTKIADLADNAGNKYFRLVAQDFGQLENHNGNSRPPVSWPCVLIDIDETKFEDLSDRVQTGNGQVIFRLGFPPFSDSSSIAPQEYKEKALYYYELEQVLYRALHGWIPTIPDQEAELHMSDIFGHLMRTSASTEQRSDFIRVRVLTFAIALDDYSAKQQQLYAPAALNLNLEFDLPE